MTSISAKNYQIKRKSDEYVREGRVRLLHELICQ